MFDKKTFENSKIKKADSEFQFQGLELGVLKQTKIP